MGRNSHRGRRVPPISGSVTGSIAEEDENQTSGSEDEGNLVVHENQRGGHGGRVPPPAHSNATMTQANGNAGSKRFSAGNGVGVPSITDFRGVQRRNSGSSVGSSDDGRQGGRRTQSEVGMGYKSPRNRSGFKRQSLRRTFSGGAASDGSSVRSLRGNGKKRGGFFKSIAKLFKTKPAGETGSIRGSRRGGADSPPLTKRNTSGWTTRTDINLRARSGGRSAAADSSDDEDTMGRGPMMAVTNNRNNTWSVDKVGLAQPIKAGKTTKKSRSDLGAGKGRSNSQSTITPATGGTGSAKVVSKPPGVSPPGIARSNTMNSVSTAGDKSSKRLRQGSITRTRASGSQVGAPSIASVLEQGKSASVTPKLMEVPKAPKSQVTPQMYTVTAPPPTLQSLLASPPPLSSSASAPLGFGDNKRVPAASKSVISTTKSVKSTASSNTTTMPRSATTNLDNLGLGAPVTANVHKSDALPPRGQTPLPPSKTLSPPAKSAMRAQSPTPQMQNQPPPPPPAFMVKAPGPVVLDKPVAVEQEQPVSVEKIKEAVPETAVERFATPATITTDASTYTDGESVYESAVEDEDGEGTDGEHAGRAKGGAPQAPASDVGSDSDDTAIMSRYKVVENTEGVAGKVKGESKVPIEDFHQEPAPAPSALPVSGQTAAPPSNRADDYVAPAPVSVTESTIERRKSVRMNVPDSPSTPIAEEESPVSPRREAGNANGWSSSRVGRPMDSSDEDESAAYIKARKGLAKYASLSASSPGKTPKKKKSASKVKA